MLSAIMRGKRLRVRCLLKIDSEKVILALKSKAPKRCLAEKIYSAVAKKLPLGWFLRSNEQNLTIV